MDCFQHKWAQLPWKLPVEVTPFHTWNEGSSGTENGSSDSIILHYLWSNHKLQSIYSQSDQSSEWKDKEWNSRGKCSGMKKTYNKRVMLGFFSVWLVRVTWGTCQIRGMRVLIRHIGRRQNKSSIALTSAMMPTQPAITAAFAWAPLIPPRPEVTNTFPDRSSAFK